MSTAQYQELISTDDHNMETTKLMQQNLPDGSNSNTELINDSNGTTIQIGNNDLNGGICVDTTNECEKLTKPECIEMSTSTASIRCCSGFIKNKKTNKKIFKDKTMTNGTTTTASTTTTTGENTQQAINSNGVGKFCFNTLKEKFTSSTSGTGKYHINGDFNKNEMKCEKIKIEKEKIKTVFEDRDPYKVNSDVRYEFLNVFSEPNSGTYSFNPTWAFTNKMYFNLKLFLYRIFAILIGIPSAFICAIIFALFSVLQIWIINPILTILKAIFGVFKQIWSIIIDALFQPVLQLFTIFKSNNFNRQQDTCTSACQSATSSKSIYNEDVNVV